MPPPRSRPLVAAVVLTAGLAVALAGPIEPATDGVDDRAGGADPTAASTTGSWIRGAAPASGAADDDGRIEAPPPGGAVRPTPEASRGAVRGGAPATAYEVDLYAARDFVPQATVDFCVPATVATMARIMTPGPGGPAFEQDRLYALARRYSTSRLRGPGAEPEGMARTLDELGFGPYVATAEPTRTAAFRLAARALRLTGRPVAVFVWRGAHAWVMSGFRATADPATTDRFRVTHLRVEDVWYPRRSSIWGRSRRPDTLVPVERLRDEFLPWHRPTSEYVEKDGKYVLVIPAG